MDDLISRKNALDEIHRVYEYEFPTASGAFDEFVTMIIPNILQNLPSAEPEQKWIPVTEKLPEDSETVLITHKGGVSFGWYNGKYWERGASTKHKPLQTVIAWMSLPSSYQGE